MSKQFIHNGYFKNGFEGWGPSDFDPKLERYETGNSVLLPIAAAIDQRLPDMDGHTLVLAFEAKAMEDADYPFISVSAGGISADGSVQVSPVSVPLTREWQRFEARLYFRIPLTHCFLNVSTPRPALKINDVETQLSLTPARIGKISLTEHGTPQA